ncbi:hypothetical protein [Kribbella sp. NBC_00359]|uniref:hypothetical protein n=1 Tax=Kribbella sp. NBC_00359 TaxID=2975966 RepID=UPI002E2000A0
MGIEDLLGGRDLGDVRKAVGFVMDNSDDFQKVLPLVRGLPDGAVGLLGKLPDLLATIGSGLADAGELATVGDALKGLGTKLSESGGSVKTLLD